MEKLPPREEQFNVNDYPENQTNALISFLIKWQIPVGIKVITLIIFKKIIVHC